MQIYIFASNTCSILPPSDDRLAYRIEYVLPTHICSRRRKTFASIASRSRAVLRGACAKALCAKICAASSVGDRVAVVRSVRIVIVPGADLALEWLANPSAQRKWIISDQHRPKWNIEELKSLRPGCDSINKHGFATTNLCVHALTKDLPPILPPDRDLCSSSADQNTVLWVSAARKTV